VGRLSIKDERANSAYMKEHKTYNTIDEDYKIVSDNESLTSVDVSEKKSEDEFFLDNINMAKIIYSHSKDVTPAAPPPNAK
jgi:hypothetical protein